MHFPFCIPGHNPLPCCGRTCLLLLFTCLTMAVAAMSPQQEIALLQQKLLVAERKAREAEAAIQTIRTLQEENTRLQQKIFSLRQSVQKKEPADASAGHDRRKSPENHQQLEETERLLQQKIAEKKALERQLKLAEKDVEELFYRNLALTENADRNERLADLAQQESAGALRENNALEQKNSLQASQLSQLQEENRGLRQQLTFLQQENQRLLSLQAEHSRLITEYFTQDKSPKIQNCLGIFQAQLQELQRQREQAASRLEDARRRMEIAQRQKEQLQQQQLSANEQLAEYQSQLSQATRRLAKAEEQIRNMQNQAKDVVRTLQKNDLAPEKAQNLSMQLEELQKKYNSLQTQYQELLQLTRTLQSTAAERERKGE